jgi:hypothetical protein
MFEVLSNGTQYAIAPIGAIQEGWMTIGSANTLEEAWEACKKDWERFWELCGIVPTARIRVNYLAF